MARKSTRENKTEYQKSREKAGLSREAASEAIGWMSEDRIERIESGKVDASPGDVAAMAQCYKDPSLCNYYCAEVCAIGDALETPKIEIKDIARTTLEMLATLNTLNQKKDRLIEIMSDGIIDESEKRDFHSIENNLDKMSLAIDALKLWLEQTRINASPN